MEMEFKIISLHVKSFKRENIDPETIFHTDQSAIYFSKAFNKLLDNYTIKRAMSRAGTPTDKSTNWIFEWLNKS